MSVLKSYPIQVCLVQISVPHPIAYIESPRCRYDKLYNERNCPHVKYLSRSKVIDTLEEGIIECEVCENAECCKHTNVGILTFYYDSFFVVLFIEPVFLT